MSRDSRGPTEAVSPPTINPLRRIGEREVTGDTNSDSDSRRRSRSPRQESRNLRPKGSDDAAPEQKNEDEESEIVIPEAKRIPNTPSIAEYLKHQVTHYPFQDWCPICVKNAAKNKPHKKVTNIRESEVFSLDYMYMTSKPTTEELAHPILVIKARVSGGVWALPVTRKGCLLYTSPSPRDLSTSRMPSSA